MPGDNTNLIVIAFVLFTTGTMINYCFSKQTKVNLRRKKKKPAMK